MTELRLFTSESVTEGHPDKICDQISDSILDGLLAEDPGARVAVETLVTTGLVHVAGEVPHRGLRRHPGDRAPVSSTASATPRARPGSTATRAESASRSASSRPTSPPASTRRIEHREGGSADPLDAHGAGDQGIMFGYATNETPQLMPMAIWTAHRLAERLADVRRTGALPFLRPDGKTQVTLGYDGAVPKTVDTVVLSTQHQPDISQDDAPGRRAGRGHPAGARDDRARHLRHAVLHQPGGPVRHRRPEGRRGSDRTQDHHRHLRRRRAARRRRVQRQRPVEGRPLRRLRHALGREERRRSGPRGPPRGAGRLRDRQGQARSDSTSSPSGPGTSPTRPSRVRSSTSSTSARRPSSISSTCCDRSTPRRPRTATSAESSPTSPGSAPTASTTCARAAGL